MKKKIWIFVSLIVAASLAGAAFLAYKEIDRRYPWLWMYIGDALRPNPVEKVDGPVHILFTFTDHFEPDDPENLARWIVAYRDMAVQHRDADGRHPQQAGSGIFRKRNRIPCACPF